MKVSDIWNAIDQGKTVCWVHEGYEVHPVDDNGSDYAALSRRNGKALRCTCVANYFGGYLHESDLSKCFVVDKQPTLK